MKNIKHFKALDQLVFWLFIFLFIFDYQFIDSNWFSAIWRTSLEVMTYMALVYINLKLLIPIFLEKKKLVLFGFSLIMLALIYVIILRISGLEHYFYDVGGWRNIISMLLNAFLFLLLSSLYSYLKKSNRQQQLNLTLKAEKAEAELRFLKAQISPHFIFNTLNNIYSLILQKHDNAAKMVTYLSKIMRYSVYHASRKKINLIQEIEHLQSYIDLFLLQKPESENIDTYQEGDFNNLQIAPLLLINFLENALKHGDMNVSENAWIKISIHNNEKNFLYSVENSKPNEIRAEKSKGIGLENTQSQLDILYPDHQLTIENKRDTYKISLSILIDQLK